MREVHVPLVWRYVGALGHVTQIAQIALLDHFVVVCLGDAVHLHGVTLIDKIKQGREGVTEADASATAMADIVDAFELFFE
jgi:hypothetical protein